MNSDINEGNVTQQDIEKTYHDVLTKGWGRFAIDVFINEPVLAELISTRWVKMKFMLERLGLTEAQSRPVLQQMARLMVEGISLVQRSSRRLWDDLLPQDGDDTTKEGSNP